MKSSETVSKFLSDFSLDPHQSLFDSGLRRTTKVEYAMICGQRFPRFINEFWTAKQRQGNSLHEIAYRACFKAQLPRFFINLFTRKGNVVYDPFSGRGTTAIEAALLNRIPIANDVNPLSEVLTRGRFFYPNIRDLERRLEAIEIAGGSKAEIDLSMFYHPETEAEIVSLRNYLRKRKENGTQDDLDWWIRMVATNRLTGHSPGFFSVYTLPPNQAVSPENQVRINLKLNQKPDYRDTKKIILRKTTSLLRDVTPSLRRQLHEIGRRAVILTSDARLTDRIADESVMLTVTSPPFLDVVQYDEDNWLRCWFNSIDLTEVGRTITIARTVADWENVMLEVFEELFRITRKGGWVAFEVGEVRNRKVMLDEVVVPLGEKAGFMCHCIVINQQEFTKTANIWGVSNNRRGTNTNRIVIFEKR